MNCPACSGELATYVDGPVTHRYCPECQPGYTDRGGALMAAVALGAVLASIGLYPFLWLYLRLRGESF